MKEDLFERSAEIGKDRQRYQVHADQRLKACHRPNPSDRLHVVFTLCEHPQPTSKVEIPKSEIKGRHQAKKHCCASQTPLSQKQMKRILPRTLPSLFWRNSSVTNLKFPGMFTSCISAPFYNINTGGSREVNEQAVYQRAKKPTGEGQQQRPTRVHSIMGGYVEEYSVEGISSTVQQTGCIAVLPEQLSLPSF